MPRVDPQFSLPAREVRVPIAAPILDGEAY
jgi:hypothetical protein